MNKKSILSASVLFIAPTLFAQESKPNFVFFMAEDLTNDLFEIYQGEGKGAETPCLESVLGDGVVFNNCYSNAPVSSAARSTLITGTYAPQYGISWHRKLSEVQLPEDLRMFPTYLQNAGYHTSNAQKTDYNAVLDTEAWTNIKGKMGAWRERESEDTPFFHCYTNAECHEGHLHFPASDVQNVETYHNPDNVTVYPYYPNTELFRYTFARLYDEIRNVDMQFGKMMSMLKEDGLLDNTFVFYFGDNGGHLPGTKGYTSEGGLKVPLYVYIPTEWRDKVPFEVGTTSDGFVSFMDFSATLLNLAGVEIPETMAGVPFMGEGVTKKDIAKRNEVFGYGNRFDDLYQMNRTVRVDNFKYSRNFAPYQPKGLYTFYRYRMEAFQEWRELFEAGKLNADQSRFFEPQGVEELYDLSVDPYELNNLASDPKYKKQLKKLRARVEKNMIARNDLGFVPEDVWVTETKNIEAYSAEQATHLDEYLAATRLQLLPEGKAVKEIAKALQSENKVVRYWAAVAACSIEGNEKLNKLMADHADDSYSSVQCKVAIYMAKNHIGDPLSVFKSALKASTNGAATLLVLNDATFVKDGGFGYDIRFNESDIAVTETGVKERLEYLNK